MLNCHVDDSGSDPNDPVLVLGGFFATAAQWIEFSKHWSAVLTAPPAIEYFKAWEAESRDEQFEGFSEPERDAKIDALVEVIKCPQYGLTNIDCVIGWANYKMAAAGRLLPKKSDHPYFWAFYKMLLTVTTYQRQRGMCEKVDFIFDDQGKIGKRARRWYDKFLKIVGPEVRERLGAEPIFRSDKEVVALQAADLYAWYVHRYACDYLLLPGMIPPRKQLQSILELKGPSTQLTRETLSEMIEGTYRRHFPRTYPK